VIRSGADRDLYFEDAARQLESLVRNAQVAPAQRSVLLSFAKQLASHSRTESDVDRMRAIERDLQDSGALDVDASQESIAAATRSAMTAAREEQFADALAYWRSAVRVSEHMSDHARILRTLPAFMRAFALYGPLPRQLLDSLDVLVERSSVLAARDLEIGNLTLVERLEVMGFMVGWLEQARAHQVEEVLRRVMRSVQRDAITTNSIGLARGFALVDLGIHAGLACRSSAAGAVGPPNLAPETLEALATRPRRPRKRLPRPSAES